MSRDFLIHNGKLTSDLDADGNQIKNLPGVAHLVDGKVPSDELPSYVDDVLEYATRTSFPATGERGKIYVALDTNKTYRWSGTTYVEIAGTPTLDDAVTRTSANGVKSSGIWAAIWGALTALPTGFSSLYDWCVAQLSGKASTADATLTPIYGPTSSATWTITYPQGYSDDPVEGVYYGDPGGEWGAEQWYYSFGGYGIPTENTNPNASTLTYAGITATRTDAPVGYQLGAQANKPLASEAEAEALRTAVAGKQDALSSTQLANIAAVPNKANAADLPYAIVTKSYSSGVAMDDRAINHITNSSGTTATLSLPPQVSNKSRDFYIVVDGNSGSDMVVTVTGAYLINPDMSAATLAVPAGTVRAWRLTEQMNGVSALSLPATFMVTGANFQEALNDIAAGLDAVIGAGGDVPVVYPIDSALSSSSTNPVQNRVITAALSGYAFHAATVSSGTTPTVTDLFIRAINYATLGSTVTAATVTLPAATTGRSRDFYIDLTIEASTAPTLTFIDPATGTTAVVKFGADSLADIDTGDNLVLWTELPNNRWLVSVKHEEAS